MWLYWWLPWGWLWKWVYYLWVFRSCFYRWAQSICSKWSLHAHPPCWSCSRITYWHRLLLYTVHSLHSVIQHAWSTSALLLAVAIVLLENLSRSSFYCWQLFRIKVRKPVCSVRNGKKFGCRVFARLIQRRSSARAVECLWQQTCIHRSLWITK